MKNLERLSLYKYTLSEGTSGSPTQINYMSDTQFRHNFNGVVEMTRGRRSVNVI